MNKIDQIIESDVVIVRFNGYVSLQEGFLFAIQNHQTWGARPVLWDHSRNALHEWDIEEIREIFLKAKEQIVDASPRKSALLSSNPLHLGILELVRGISKRIGSHSSLEVFQSESKALAWLRED